MKKIMELLLIDALVYTAHARRLSFSHTTIIKTGRRRLVQELVKTHKGWPIRE